MSCSLQQQLRALRYAAVVEVSSRLLQSAKSSAVPEIDHSIPYGLSSHVNDMGDTMASLVRACCCGRRQHRLSQVDKVRLDGIKIGTCCCGGRQNQVAGDDSTGAVLLDAVAGGHVPQVALRTKSKNQTHKLGNTLIESADPSYLRWTNTALQAAF